MKTKLLVLFSVVLSMTLQAAAPWDGTIATSFAGGDGSSSNPYQISTPAQLAYLAQQVNANALVTTKDMYFILTTDLDLNRQPWTPIGNSTNSFKGRLDGKFHVISNLNVNLSATTGVGLFGYTESPYINNLGIVGNSTVTGAAWAGGIIGRCYISASNTGMGIGKCFSNAVVSTGTGDGSGGIVGDWRQSSGRTYPISNCYSTGNISGNNYVAGIVGKVENAGLTITNSYSTGTMTAAGSNLRGGIVTIVTGAAPTITNCYYINGDGTNALTNFGTVQTTTQLKALAGTLGSAYITDWTGGLSLNNGYPIYKPFISVTPYTVNAFTTTYGTASAAQAFSIAGNNLGAAITATAPTGFEVSSDGTNYAGTATYTMSGGSASGTVYIRLKANASVSGTYDAKNIGLSSTSASTVNIATTATGNAVSATSLTITANDVNKTYGTALNGASGSTAFTSSGLVNGESISSVTIAYGTGSAANAAVGTYSTTAVVPSAATGGTFTAGNYSITYSTGNIIVGAKPLTITADNQTVTYGTDPSVVTGAGTYTPTGFITGENASVIGNSPTYSTTYTKTTAVGTAGVTITPIVTGLTATNYSFTPVAGTVTIAQATPTLSLATSSVTYSGSAQAATVNSSVTGTVSNVKYNGSSTVPTTASSYPVTADFAPTDATNYVSLTSASAGTFTIAQATPTLSLATSSVTYNGSAQAATVNSSVTGTVSNVKYNGSSTVPTTAGSYLVTADFAPTDATNYVSLTGASAGTFTINATVPDAPIVGTATAGNAQVSVAFAAPSNNGGSSILDYTVTPYVGATAGTPVTGSGSPLVVTGLSNGTAYTFTVTARNIAGSSAASSASNAVTPDAVTNNITVLSATNISSLTLTPVSDIVVSSSRLTVDITESKTVNSITVAPGAELTVSSGTINATNGITLQSSPDGTGTLVDNYSVPTVNATVQQQVEAGRNWYLSSPISTGNSSVLSRGDSVVHFNESLKKWEKITGSLTTGRGYIQTAIPTHGSSGIISFNGLTNSGDVTVPVSRTESGSNRGFNLVGNPYPSYLDWSLAIADGANTNIGTTMWYRTKNTLGNYTFATYNGTSGESVTGTGTATTTISKYIPPMQAFWVRVNANADQTTYSTSLIFKNTMRLHRLDNTNTLKAPKLDVRKRLRLQVFNGTNADETLIFFDPNALDGFDNYDSPKMSNGSITIPEIYTVVGGEHLVINGLNAIPYDTELPIGFTTGQAGSNFSIKASQFSNFETGTQILLHDYTMNTSQDLALSDYTFTSEAVSTASRFTLTFHAPSVNTGINPGSNSPIWISTRNGQLLVNGVDNGATLDIFNVLGQKLISKMLHGTTTEYNKILSPGTYLVRVSNEGKSIMKKIIID